MKKSLIPLLTALVLIFSACTRPLPNIPPSEVTTAVDTSSTVTDTPETDGEDSEPSPGTLPPTPVVTTPEPDPPTAPDETSEGILNPEDPELPIEVEHTDADNDGNCDECGISVVIVLDLFAINDLHGKFCDSDTQGGVDELTTYLKSAYETEDHVILLSSGDMWQGSSESNLTRGYIITEWMNHLDFVSMTLGNHEYDWGETYIENNATLAGFPFLAINIYDRDTDERVSYCKSSVLVQRGGARIGIIGAIGDCYSSISGEMSAGVYFKTGRDLTELVKAEAQELRDAGADFIIFSVHDGYGSSSSGAGSISDSALSSYYDPILSEGYVDIVFEGHSHQRYILKDNDGVYHLQGGGDNKGITHAEASINFANGQSTVTTAEFVYASEYANLEDDPIVDTLMEKYKDQVSVGDAVLGYNDSYRSGDYLRRLVASLYRQVGETAFGQDYDIVLGGGFISVRSPYELAAGKVTYSQLQMLFPFDNTLVLCSVKGSDLKSKFINTSNDNYFVSYTDYGNTVRGRIDSNATYYVLVVTYTSIPDVYRIGNALADNGQTDESYYVKGRIVSISNTTYGDLTIDDGQGNTLYIFGLYDSTGSVRYDAMSDPPEVGDSVVLLGPVKKYVSGGKTTIELMRARLIATE